MTKLATPVVEYCTASGCGRWLLIQYVDGPWELLLFVYSTASGPGERSGCALVLVVLSQRQRLIALLSDA